MSARSKASIVEEARGIAKNFGISVQAGDFAGRAQGDTVESMTKENAIIRLLLLQIELLADIRQGESLA